MRFAVTIVLGGISLVLPRVLHGQEAPLTVAESSAYRATSRYEEVIDFVRELQRLSADIRVGTLAVSAEGRRIPLLVIGDPVPSSPADLRFDKRAVVYFQANIHGGEVAGKEAALMLARDILIDRTPDYLDQLVILIAPIFNADGNEKISPNNRGHQNGPAQGVGIRPNGLNQDLNRDGMKLESPEVQGLVRSVLVRWDPVFFFDSHTSNGSYHKAPVTWTWGLSPNGDGALIRYMESTVWPAIEAQMREEFGIATLPYGDFVDPRDPALGWAPMGPQPRYLTNMIGLRNRLSVLNEQYPYVSFAERIDGAYALMRSFLDFLGSHRQEIVRLVLDADRRTVERGANPQAADVFAVEHEREPVDRRVTVEGYEMIVTETGGPYPDVTPTEQEKTYRDLPYLARFAPKQVVQLPHGYLIAGSDSVIIDKLRQHGLRVDRLVEPVVLRVESFSVTRLSGAALPTQGHYPNAVEGEYVTREMKFLPGTAFVTMAQPLANVAAYLLEPESDDGLVSWNFFDRYLGHQEPSSQVHYPVYRLLIATNLVTEALP